MKINLELSEQDLKALILREFKEQLPNANLVPNDINIMVKSKQNYKLEWEVAAFKATVNKG